MKRIYIALIFIVGNSIFVAAQSGGNSGKIAEQIMKLEAELIEATKKMSAEDFERLHAADFTMTVRLPPRVVTRAEIAELRKNPNVRRGAIESLINSDEKTRVYGDSTAVVTGAWKRVSRDADGKDTSLSGRFTHVWVKQNGKWLLAAAHYSPDVDLEKLKAAAVAKGEGKN